MNKKRGTLYGIGVGPGDPELITLKAVRILKRVDLVFTAASTKNSFSLAVRIAEPHIPETTKVEALSFPMTADLHEKEEAWAAHVARIIKALEKGKDVAFLTLGDPMTYSTFGYLLTQIKEKFPEETIVTIPGITSYQAAAACVNTPLVEGEESLLLASGAYGGEHLKKTSDSIENIVILKAYKNISDIRSMLEDNGMIDNSVAVSKCSREDEAITDNIRDLETRKPDYWTLILAKQPKNGTYKKTETRL